MSALSAQSKKFFRKRSFVTLMAAISGLGLPPTGIAVHVFQDERMTVQGHAWMTAHIILGFVFIVFAAWHAILNRRVLISHVQPQAARWPGVSREIVCALALVCLVLFLTVGHAFHGP